MKHIVLATQNANKIDEIAPHLEYLHYTVDTLADFAGDVVIKEKGSTLEENALLKARALRTHTSAMVLADDSGLEVDALGGKPGVMSKRFSNEGTDDANNRLLLEKMANERNRRATFKTVMALIEEDGSEHIFEGTLPGYIHTALEGEEGFGYDPLFIPVGYSKTLAALGMDVKNTISHRRKCLERVLQFLRK